MTLPEIEFWAWVFDINYQTLSRKSWYELWFWLTKLWFFPGRFNNFSEIAHILVLWLEFLMPFFCLSLSFFFEFWVFLRLSFYKNVQSQKSLIKIYVKIFLHRLNAWRQLWIKFGMRLLQQFDPSKTHWPNPWISQVHSSGDLS